MSAAVSRDSRLEEMGLQMFKEATEWMARGRLFHRRASATPNALSPTVRYRVCGMTSLWVADDCRSCRELLVVAQWVQVSCQVRRRGVAVTAEDKYSQSDFNTLRGTQPMQVWSSGVARSYFRLPCIILAAALSTDWIRSSMYVGIPTRVALP